MAKMKGATKADLKRIDKMIADYHAQRWGLIPLLHDIQEVVGYIPREAVPRIARGLNLFSSQVQGVVTFYEQFYLQPHGHHTVRCCRGTACHVKGGHNIIKTLKRTLGVEPGETTDDMEFTFETVACLGACALAPVMVVDGTYYGKMSYRKVGLVVDSLRTAGNGES